MIGKWILIFGVLLVVVGAVVWLIETLGLRLGRLPADIRMGDEKDLHRWCTKILPISLSRTSPLAIPSHSPAPSRRRCRPCAERGRISHK